MCIFNFKLFIFKSLKEIFWNLPSETGNWIFVDILNWLILIDKHFLNKKLKILNMKYATEYTYFFLVNKFCGKFIFIDSLKV